MVGSDEMAPSCVVAKAPTAFPRDSAFSITSLSHVRPPSSRPASMPEGSSGLFQGVLVAEKGQFFLADLDHVCVLPAFEDSCSRCIKGGPQRETQVRIV